MKLQNQTSLYYSGAFLGILVLNFIISNFFINYFVIQRLESSLLKDKRIVEGVLEQNDSIPTFPGFAEHELYIGRVSNPLFQGNSFQDLDFFSERENESIAYRELHTFFSSEGITYELKIRRALTRTRELIVSLLISSLLAIALLLLGLMIIHRQIHKNLWNPFYKTLEKLSSFELKSTKNPNFENSSIQEFEALNHALNVLTDKIYQDYQGQKHFVENASHELQTPLAVIKTQLELLLQTEGIEREDSKLVAKALNAADQLTKINKSLITLSRIENLQFPETSLVELNQLIDENMILFNMEAQAKEIEIHYLPSESCEIQVNKTLANLMVRNMIQNAIRHNSKKGKVWIDIGRTHLTIQNTGVPIEVPKEKLFERFYKSSDSEGSIGLGLPIVKEICDLYGFKIIYTYSGPIHIFKIFFLPH